MRPLSDSRDLRLATFALLYFSQGVPWGFLTVSYALFLSDAGLDSMMVGAAIGVAHIPWTLKLVWGPLTDRYRSVRFGRRPFVFAAQLVMAATLLALLPLDPTRDLTVIGAILLVHMMFAALQDVAVDGMAVDLLPAAERGLGNGIMIAAKAVGIACGGGGATLLALRIGWPAVFLIIGLMTLLISLVVLVVREHRSDAAAAEAAAAGARMTWRELKRSFSFAAPVVGLAIALTTPIGDAVVSATFVKMLRGHLRFDVDTIGRVTAIVMPVASVVGALLGGVLSMRFGAKRTLAGFMAGTALALAVFAASSSLWSSPGFATAAAGAFAFFGYGYRAPFCALLITLCNPAIGATQFAIYMAVMHLCHTIVAPLAGWLVDSQGHAAAFAAGAFVEVLAISLLPLCRERTAEAQFRATAA